MGCLLLPCVLAAAEPPPEAEESAPVRYGTVVRGRRPPGTAGARRIDTRQLAAAPRRTAEDLLRHVPGLLLVQHGSEGKGHQLFLRGFDAVHGSDVEVLLEDVPLNEPSNVHGQGYLDLAFLIPEVVSSLDVSKGPFLLRQGNFATAGSVAFRLGVPAAQRGIRGLYEAGTTSRHRLVGVWAPRDAPEDTFLALEALADEGFGDNRWTRRASALGQVRLWTEDAGPGRLDALAAAYAGQFGMPGALRLEDADRLGFSGSYLDDSHRGESARGLASLRWRTRLGIARVGVRSWLQARLLDLGVDYTGRLRSPEHGDRRHQHQEAGSGGFRLSLTGPAQASFRFSALATWQTDLIDQHEDLDDPGGATWERTRDLDVAQHALGLGAGLAWAGLDWLSLEAGLRVDAFGYLVEDRLQGGAHFVDWCEQVSPRLTTAVRLDTAWTLFLAAGRGLRAPEARAVTGGRAREDRLADLYLGGEPTVTAADSLEAGVRWAPSDRLRVAVAAFGVRIARESVFDHVSGLNLELNPTRRLGLEAEVRLRPSGWLELAGDVAAVDAHFEESGHPVPGAPPLLAILRALAVHPAGLSAGLHLLHLGRRPLAHGAEAAPATLLELVVGWRWRALALELQVENLLDAAWREGEYHYASWWEPAAPSSQLPVIHYVAGPPRTLRVSVSATH